MFCPFCFGKITIPDVQDGISKCMDCGREYEPYASDVNSIPFLKHENICVLITNNEGLVIPMSVFKSCE